MAQVKVCAPYASEVVAKSSLRIEETGGAFKVYFISIVGREQREKYEWECCGTATDDFLRTLEARRPEGVGFVTAFPHITKIFQFGPNPETNLYTRAYKTSTWEELPLDYSGSTEVACAAEALILADEFRFWLEASSVEAYLGRTSSAGSAQFASHSKLREHCGGKA